MKFAAAIIFDAPVQKGRAFFGSAFVARWPIGAKFVVQLAQVADARTRETFRETVFPRRHRLLPQHNPAGLRGHSGRQAQFQGENLSGRRRWPRAGEHRALAPNFVERGTNVLLRYAGVVFEAVATCQFARVRPRRGDNGSKRCDVRRVITEFAMSEAERERSASQAASGVVKNVAAQNGD